MSHGGAFLFLALLSWGCGEKALPHAPDRSPDIVLIVLDTVRPDMLSAYGHPRPTSPFLEEFARAGTRFDRAYSVSCWTLPAHGTLFTGLPPEVHGGNEDELFIADSLELLAERLRGEGYYTAAFSANTWVGPRTGLDRGFDHFQDMARRYFRRHVERLYTGADGDHPDPREHYVVQRVAEWLPVADERPLFLFVNLVDAHTPYVPHRAAAEPFFDSDEDRRAAMQRLFPEADPRALKVRHYSKTEPLDADDWRDLAALYEGSLRMTDEVCRALVETIEAARSERNTIFLILSDHGENLGDHGHFTHLFNLYDSNLRIALLARGPGFEAGRIEQEGVQIGDVHSTVLALAGASADGVDLRQAAPPGRTFRASLAYPSFSLHKGFPLDVVESGRLDYLARSLETAFSASEKWIRSSDGWEAAFDLTADPGEERPFAPELLSKEGRERLLSALETPLDPAPRASDGPTLDEEALRALEAMGYVGEGDSPER